MNSVFLPPFPFPLTVTVVSPPDKSNMGCSKRVSPNFFSFFILMANSAIFFPSNLASPSRESDITIGLKPNFSASLQALFNAIIGLAII